MELLIWTFGCFPAYEARWNIIFALLPEGVGPKPDQVSLRGYRTGTSTRAPLTIRLFTWSFLRLLLNVDKIFQ